MNTIAAKAVYFEALTPAFKKYAVQIIKMLALWRKSFWIIKSD